VSASDLRSTLLIAQRELYRNVSTIRGLLGVATLLLVWLVALLYPIRMATMLVINGQQIEGSLEIFQALGFGGLTRWPVPEFAVLWRFALLCFPMLCVMLAADQTASDRQRGSLRLLALHCSKDAIYFGRFIGAWLIQFAWIALAMVTTWILAAWRDSQAVTMALGDAVVITVNLTIVVAPFLAMMSVLSIVAGSSRQAAILAILIWTLAAGMISVLASYLPLLNWLAWLVPGVQLSALAQLSGWETLQLAPIPLLQTILLLGLGRWLMWSKPL
jgi:ABC-type transport system involved in multi-copper enzyme maturation permease subunit